MKPLIRRSLVQLAFALSMLAVMAFTMAAQTAGTVRGKAVDASTKEALVGANVLVVGTTRGTATDVDGKFSLSLPPGPYNLEVSILGYTRTARSGPVDRPVGWAGNWRPRTARWTARPTPARSARPAWAR